MPGATRLTRQRELPGLIEELFFIISPLWEHRSYIAVT
jgi:hypothetical protein